MANVFSDAQIQEIMKLINNRTAHEQYTGARYVPIFGRKGESSIEWDGGTGTYEPLTIVLHEGNSFTSRQFVPVGINILNQEFWANTGNYNAQVEQYRQEVLAFDGRITANQEAIENETSARESADTNLQEAIENETSARESADTNLQEAIENKRSHIIVIGDSYSSQEYLPNGTLWCETIANALGCILHNYAEGGAGFVATSDHQKITFSQEIDQAIADESFPHDDVSYLFILGGTNDLRENTTTNKTTLNNAIASTLQKAQNSFPNSCVIYLGSTTYQTFKNKRMSDSEVICEYYIQDQCNGKVATAGLTFFWIGQDAFFTDGYVGHPNQNAHNAFSKAVIGALSGGGNAFKHIVTIEPTLANDVSGEYTLEATGANQNKFIVTMTNKTVCFSLRTKLTNAGASWNNYPEIALPFRFNIPHANSGLMINEYQIMPVRVQDVTLNNILNIMWRYKSTNSILVYPKLFGSTTSTGMDIYLIFPFEV